MGRSQAFLALIAGGAILGACSPTVDQRGNLPEAERLAEIHPGSTTKAEVTKLLGTPSSVDLFNDNSWFYISRKTEQVAFFQPSVVDQQVYVVNFDQGGVVKTVEHKDMTEGRSINPVGRATPSPGRELSFLEQLLGNLGKFNSSK